MSIQDSKKLQQRLLVWYKKNARNLPWRRTQDPYKIWVSEIMLQQTQVDTVIPYYQKWVRRFPTLKSLAQTSRAEVMKYWAGLGYYRRVRALHDSAKLLCKEHRGKVPEPVAELMKLPGIGRYTAGAIASIAFGQKAPIVDGNVIRVLTRLWALREDVGNQKTLVKIWKLSESILPDQNPGDFNQAMMELGATICHVENPQCKICPVRKFCKAYAAKRQTDFPVKRQREKLEKIRNVALILRQGEKVLIQKQPEHVRWGGLWMFPFWKDKKTMIVHLKEFFETRGEGRGKNNDRPSAISRPMPLHHIMTLHHGFTKYRIRLDVYEGTWGKERKTREVKEETQNKKQKKLRPVKNMNEVFFVPLVSHPSSHYVRWVDIRTLGQYAFPSPHQKIAAELIRSQK